MIEASDLERTTAALSLVLAAGVCSYPFLHLPRPARAAALTILAIAVFLAPLLVRLPATGLRLVVSLASVTIGLKLYDLHRAAQTGPPPRVWEFLTYLLNGCNLALRRVTARNRPSRRADAVRLLWLVPVTIACGLIAFISWRLNWRPYPWSVEHCVKVLAVCAIIQFGLNVVASAWRLMGAAAIDFSGWFFAAATPAEFWRRWNLPAGMFLHEYVFVPAGGAHRPFVAVIATFVFSGLMHEYVFDIAAGRVLGLPFLFFFVHGLAAAVTMHLRPRGWQRAIGIGLTLSFNLLTSVMFFVCVNAAIPFYAAR